MGNIIYYKDNGFVNEVFNEVVFNYFKGYLVIGYVRYFIIGKSDRENV